MRKFRKKKYRDVDNSPNASLSVRPEDLSNMLWFGKVACECIDDGAFFILL